MLARARRLMPFINETICADDHDRYGLDTIDAWPRVGAVFCDHWTIDRARGVYLRQLTVGREDWAALSGWTLLWRGHLLYVGLERIASRGAWEGPRFTHWRLHALHEFGSDALPPVLQGYRDAIVADLYDALVVHGEDGLVGPQVTHRVRLDA